MVKNGCEVICKIDMTAYEARKAKAAQIHELKKEMDAKVAQLQAVALYELMAEKDPSLKTLLAEFKALTE
jgi:multidrug resistance efflux pump